jgi:environmental stress-induced protein Ves
MKFIRYSDLQVLPWKNGLGIRRDIAKGCHQVNSFDVNWLAAIVDLNENSQLSSYPGASRWFLPLSDGWLTLSVELNGLAIPVELTQNSPPHQFSGDASVYFQLHDGPMKALTVTTQGRDILVDISKMPIDTVTTINLDSNAIGEASFITTVKGGCKVNGESWSGTVSLWSSLLNDSGQSESIEISPVGATEIVIAKFKLQIEDRQLAQAIE